MAGIGGGRGGNGSSQRAHMRACSASGSKFQMSPCSTPARCPTPCERSDVSSSTFASGVKGEPAVAYSTDAVTMSTLAAAAAVAAANVGLPETTYRPPHSANSSPRRRSTGSVESEDSHGSGAPPSMPPLPPNQNQLSQKEKDGGGLSGRGGGGGEGGQARVTVVTGNRRGAGGRRGAHGSSDVPKELPSWGGVLSGFACLSLTEDPSTSTAAAGGETSTASRGSWVTSDSTGSHSNSSGTSASSYLSSVPGSRLPEVSSESDDDEQPGRASITSVVNRHLARLPASSGSGGGGGGGVGAGTPGDRRGNSSSRPISLDRAIAFSRGRTITPDLTPVAEVAGEDNAFFSDSDTDSDISSLASSVSGAGGSNSGGRRISRDPAMLLAAAIAKAGQVESIPAPSAGSPEQRRRLPPLEEGVPLSRAMLSPSYVSPPPRGETARSCVKVGDEEAVAAAAAAAAGAAAAAAAAEGAAANAAATATARSASMPKEKAEVEEVGVERAGQERALVSPGEGARWSGSESCRAPTAGTLVVGVRARILQYEEKNASIRDNGLASLGDLESVHDDPMSMREQTPPLSLGRPDLATPAAAADVAPASEPTAVVDATPARSSGFSLRNAFSLFLGKKGGVSGSSSENKDDSAAESECDEAMGDAPSAFFHDGERALGEAGSDDAEDLTAVSPMGSSLDDLPGLVLPTPEDGEPLLCLGGRGVRYLFSPASRMQLVDRLCGVCSGTFVYCVSYLSLLKEGFPYTLPCFATRCLALHCFALLCLGLPCHASLCLALPCFALLSVTFHCLTSPSLTQPHRASPCLLPYHRMFFFTKSRTLPRARREGLLPKRYESTEPRAFIPLIHTTPRLGHFAGASHLRHASFSAAIDDH